MSTLYFLGKLSSNRYLIYLLAVVASAALGFITYEVTRSSSGLQVASTSAPMTVAPPSEIPAPGTPAQAPKRSAFKSLESWSNEVAFYDGINDPNALANIERDGKEALKKLAMFPCVRIRKIRFLEANGRPLTAMQADVLKKPEDFGSLQNAILFCEDRCYTDIRPDDIVRVERGIVRSVQDWFTTTYPDSRGTLLKAQIDAVVASDLYGHIILQVGKGQ